MGAVRFWLDSANIDDVKWAVPSYMVSGVTVNQSLLAKEPQQPLMDALTELKKLCIADAMYLSIPLTETNPSLMYKQGREYLERFKSEFLMIKVPVSRETLDVIGELAAGGAHVNATCIFTGLQAALAAECGASVLSVFVGRINDDSAGYGWKVLQAARSVCGDAEVLAGSIRDKAAVGAAIDHGAHIITASRKVLVTLADDPGSAKSIAKFNADYEAWSTP